MSGAKRGSDAVQWGEARRWFATADEDIRTAEVCLKATPQLVDAAAFHCQQAAEKMLKGLLVAARRKAEKSHDLELLARSVAEVFPELADDMLPIRQLTPWYVATRYPDIDAGPQPTASEVCDVLHRLGALRRRADALEPTGGNGCEGDQP